MSFNNHIGIFIDKDGKTAYEQLQEAITNHKLVSPWVAYVNGVMVYPDNVVVQDANNVNMFDEIVKTLPVLCTEDEYDILVTNGEGTITDPRTKESTYVTFDPNLYYYTYDETELK